MRIVVLSRQFNRSGYAVLEALIESELCEIVGVFLPPLRPSQSRMARLDSVATAWIERATYRLECACQGARPLRFEGSLKRLASRAGLDVEVVSSLKDSVGLERLARHHPDLLVLGGGWPELLPAEVFSLAPLGAINTHPSLLPSYRGTDVHRWQILDGVRETGTTIHYVDHRFDTGAIIRQAKVRLDEAETPQGLFQGTADVAGELMVEVIGAIEIAAPRRAKGRSQMGTAQSSLPKWPWTDDRFLQIDPRLSAVEVERLVRASTQESFVYGGPWIGVGGRQFIVRRATTLASAPDLPVGTLATRAGLPILVCAEGALVLDRVQERGSVPMRTRSLSGRRFARRHLRTESPVRIASVET